MNLPLSKNKKGFTIIEVALVLAVGGLIMLMVFIAWPAVQRNQRDSQRRTVDLPHLYTSIVNYASNNKGAIPTGSGKQLMITGGETAAGSNATTGWGKFYTDYVVHNGTDTFADPASGYYGLNVISCSVNATNMSKDPNKGLTKGQDCDNTAQVNGANTLATGKLNLKYEDQGAYVTIVIGAYCDRDTVKAATKNLGGTRNYAIMYALESGGVFCQGS